MKLPKNLLANSQRERGVASSAVLGVRVLIVTVRLVHQLRNLGYMLAFLAYDLLIVSIAFFVRRPRFRKLIYKLLRCYPNRGKSEPDDSEISLTVEQWLNTVDHLYYVTHSGWLDGRFAKTPNAES